MPILTILLLIINTFNVIQYPSVTQDMDLIKQMLIEGDRAGATALLEELVQQENPEVEALRLLLDQYHQSFAFSKIISQYEQHQEKLYQDPSMIFYYAMAKHQTGFTGQAIEILDGMRSMETVDERGIILLGRIYYQDDRWEEALPVFRELSDLLPDNLYFRTQKARIHRMLQNRERSLEILNEVLEEDETYLPAILEMTVTRYTANELDEARILLDRALEIYPNENRLLNYSARTAYNQQQYQKALNHWKREVELGEAESSTYRGIALIYYSQDDLDSAIENFTIALTLNPGDMMSLMYMAMVYRQMEDWEQTGFYLNELYELHISDYLIDTVMQRAVVHEAQGDIDSAISDYTLATLLHPEYYHANFYIAALKDRHSGDKEEVIERYQSYLESPVLDPELEEYARGRLKVLLEEQHFARGRQ